MTDGPGVDGYVGPKAKFWDDDEGRLVPGNRTFGSEYTSYIEAHAISDLTFFDAPEGTGQAELDAGKYIRTFRRRSLDTPVTVEWTVTSEPVSE